MALVLNVMRLLGSWAVGLLRRLNIPKLVSVACDRHPPPPALAFNCGSRVGTAPDLHLQIFDSVEPSGVRIRLGETGAAPQWQNDWGGGGWKGARRGGARCSHMPRQGRQWGMLWASGQWCRRGPCRTVPDAWLSMRPKLVALIAGSLGQAPDAWGRRQRQL